MKKDLQRTEKALAETAALIILRKKAQAIWGEPEEDWKVRVTAQVRPVKSACNGVQNRARAR